MAASIYICAARAVFNIDRLLVQFCGRAFAEKLLSNKPDAQLEERIASALVHEAFTLSDIGRSADAIGVYDEVLERFRTASEPEISDTVSIAIYNRGVILNKLGRFEEALEAYEELLRRPAESSSSSQQLRVAKALVNEATVLVKLERPREAEGTFAEVVRHFGETSDPPFVEQIAMALFNRACLFSLTMRLQESLADLTRSISLTPQRRKGARADSDFDNLRNDPTLGPEFLRLVGEDQSDSAPALP